MGWFKADKDTILTAKNGRDFASVDEATDRLMTDIMSRLRKINDNIMIEFRQPYIGPRMRKYGNMFRAGDCPNESIVNRIRTTDIRLLADFTAVHSDMYVWHNNEPKEQSALQLLNVLFSVPQLSVKLDEVSKGHLEMIRFWTGYWKKNRKVLLQGSFIPSSPGANYPLIRGRSASKTIIAVYDEVIVPITAKDSSLIDIVNGKLSRQIILDMQKNMGKKRIKIFDCSGVLKSSNQLNLREGVIKLTVPPSGLIVIK
jgi:alpha-galactosidase